MNVFELAAVLTLNKDDYDKGLSDAEKSASGFGSKLAKGAKIGAAGVAAVGTAVAAAGTALVKGAKETAEYGDNIDKMSQKLGISAEAYQKWDYVMGQAGTSIDSMKGSFKTLSKQVEEAKNGNEDAIASFQNLGISIDDLSSMSSEDLFANVIKGFQGMEEGSERTALATQLLGRGAMELGPLFNSTAESTEELMQKAEDLGMVLSNDAVKASADFQDALDTLQRTMGGLKNKLMSDFLPGFAEVMTGLSDIFAGKDSGIGQITSGITSITNKITEALPKVLEVASQIVLSLASAIVENLPMLVETGAQVIMELSNGIIEMLPQILEVGIQVITSLLLGIAEAMPELTDTIVGVALEMVTILTQPETLNGLLEAGLQLLLALGQGLIDALPQLIEALPEIIDNIVQFLISARLQMMEAGMQLFLALVDALPEIISALIETIPQIISSLINNIKENLPKFVEAGKNLLKGLGSGLVQAISTLGSAVGQVMTSLGNSFKEKIKDAISWGKDLIDNFVQGLRNRMHRITEIIKEIAQKIKNLLGFSEPKDGPLSNFHTYAPDMMELFAKGVRDNEDLIKDQIAASFDFGGMMVAPTLDLASATVDVGITAVDEILEILKRGDLNVGISNTRELVRVYG